MMNTLPEPKRSTLAPIRDKLLVFGFSEEVEYDYINVEPVLVYHGPGRLTILLKHKGETSASVLLETEEQINRVLKTAPKFESLVFEDEQGKTWLRFPLPDRGADLSELFSIL
jgi:hypothetical protein